MCGGTVFGCKWLKTRRSWTAPLNVVVRQVSRSTVERQTIKYRLRSFAATRKSLVRWRKDEHYLCCSMNYKSRRLMRMIACPVQAWCLDRYILPSTRNLLDEGVITFCILHCSSSFLIFDTTHPKYSEMVPSTVSCGLTRSVGPCVCAGGPPLVTVSSYLSTVCSLMPLFFQTNFCTI